MALAASDAPQFLWQAGDADHVVEADYSYSNLSVQTAGGANERTLSRSRFGLSYEYGLSDMISLGVSLDYLTGQMEVGSSKANLSGIEHIGLDFKGNYGLGFGKLYYGLNAKLSIEDQETEANGDMNASLGRHSFTPFVALAMKSGRNAYGAKVAYQYNLETKQDLSGSTFELDGGHGLFASLYLERDLSDKSLFGFAFNYANFADFEDQAGNKLRDNIALNNMSIDLYGAVGCGCSSGGWMFLPKASYFIVDDEDQTKANDIESSGGSYAFELALRKRF